VNVRQERRQWLEQHVAVSKQKILEFGAFDYPTYLKSEAAIEYLDYFSKSELGEIHTAAKPERVKNAIEVDHVIKEIDFAKHLPAQFDLLIANHVIEHVPDLIGWLSNASSLLTNNSSRIFLSIPDKEYTFDKIRPLTTLSDLLLAREEKLVAPSVRQVFESLYYYRPIRAKNAWEPNAEDGELLARGRFLTADIAWQIAKEKVQKKGFLDVHCTVFTYESFLDLMIELERAGYTRLKVLHSADVQRLSNEFWVLLG
jgi:methyltransferase family protein